MVAQTDLSRAQADQNVGFFRHFVGGLHQLCDRMIDVTDGVEGPLPLQRVGPLEREVEFWNFEKKTFIEKLKLKFCFGYWPYV